MLKFLQLFLEAVFLGKNMNSLLSEFEVFSRQTRIVAKNGVTFDSTVGLRPYFYMRFLKLFSLD